MGGIDQSLRVGAIQTWKTDFEVSRDTKPSLRTRSDTDRRCHRRVIGNTQFLRRRDGFHRSNEASGVPCSEKLFGVVARAACAA